jgi:DNA repair exonuclease SbcCD ATPase subunit
MKGSAMNDDLVKHLRECANGMRTFMNERGDYGMADTAADRIEALQDALAHAEAERDEMKRRRDEWRSKAEGFDTIRHALRQKVGAPWPPNLSRTLWAALAADEKKRADDAEAERDGLAKSLMDKFDEMERLIGNFDKLRAEMERLKGDFDKLLAERDGAYALKLLMRAKVDEMRQRQGMRPIEWKPIRETRNASA